MSIFEDILTELKCFSFGIEVKSISDIYKRDDVISAGWKYDSSGYKIAYEVELKKIPPDTRLPLFVNGFPVEIKKKLPSIMCKLSYSFSWEDADLISEMAKLKHFDCVCGYKSGHLDDNTDWAYISTEDIFQCPKCGAGYKAVWLGMCLGPTSSKDKTT